MTKMHRIRGISATVILGAAVILGGCSAQALSSARVMDIDSAQGVNPTGNFTMAGKWDLNYHFDCSKQRSEGINNAKGFSMIVYNSDDASAAFEHPELKVRATSGGETLHFHRGGTYRVAIDSLCDWRISADDLSGT
jgi:hypothetical protein